ncbi:hypothetical protein BKA80DRAFT_333482 [Phyllosticta citrichinensis]
MNATTIRTRGFGTDGAAPVTLRFSGVLNPSSPLSGFGIRRLSSTGLRCVPGLRRLRLDVLPKPWVGLLWLRAGSRRLSGPHNLLELDSPSDRLDRLSGWFLALLLFAFFLAWPSPDACWFEGNLWLAQLLELGSLMRQGFRRDDPICCVRAPESLPTYTMEGRPCFSSAPHLDYANEFLVKWRDAQTGHTLFLGQLASSGRRCGELSMWFADDADEKCMIGLSLPLKVRVASKKRRDVHFILPAQSFASPDNLFSVDVVTAQDDPEAAHEFRRAGLGSSTKLLRLSFALQEHGYAMMPTEPFKNPLPSNSRGLLLSLRSLSRSTAFEVYLPYLESAADLLERFATKARSVPVDSPSIDHVKTYSGRSWGVDEWAVYGIEDEEAMPNAWNPVVDDDPSPYEEAVREKSDHPESCTKEHPENSPDPSQDEFRQHLKLLLDLERPLGDTKSSGQAQG